MDNGAYGSFKYNQALYGAAKATTVSNITAFVKSVTETLVRDKLEVRYVPALDVYSGSSDLGKNFIRFMEHTGSADVSAALVPVTPRYLYATIKAWQYRNLPAYLRARHERFLTGYLETIEPGYLTATIVPYWYKSLRAYLYSIPPQYLPAFIRTQQEAYQDLLGDVTPSGGWELLGASITPYARKSLLATITSWDTLNLNAFINLLGAGPPVDLQATIGARHWKNLKFMITGRLAAPEHKDLRFSVRTNQFGYRDVRAMVKSFAREVPSDLQAAIDFIEPVPLLATIAFHEPEFLYATVNLVSSGKYFDRLSIYYGPTKDLQGLINASGGWKKLIGTLKSVTHSSADLEMQLQAYDTLLLQASIDLNYFSNLSGQLQTVAIADSIKLLEGKLRVMFYSELLASIGFNDNKSDLLASISPKGEKSDLLGRLIVDEILYSDVISIQTKMMSDLKALILISSECYGSSGFKELTGFLRTFEYGKAQYNSLASPKTELDETLSYAQYPGTVRISGDYTGLKARTYYIRAGIDVANTGAGDSAGGDVMGGGNNSDGAWFTVDTSDGVDENPTPIFIQEPGVPYPVGSLGLYVTWEDNFPLGNEDYWVVSVGKPPGMLEASIAFRPFMSYLSATIAYGTSFQGVKDLQAIIGTKGGFASLMAYIETNARDLHGAIRAITPASSDLQAYTDIWEWNVFLRATIQPTLLVPRDMPHVDEFKFITAGKNKTIKQVRMNFSGKGEDYIYSQLLTNTFLNTGDKWGVALTLKEEEQDALSGQFGSPKIVKRKLLFDISQFASFDEAVRYCAKFIAYGISSSLPASITPSGGFKELTGYMTIQDPNKLRDLYMRLQVVDLTKVTVQGLINATGGFHKLQGVIKGTGSAYADVSASIYSTNQSDLEATIQIT